MAANPKDIQAYITKIDTQWIRWLLMNAGKRKRKHKGGKLTDYTGLTLERHSDPSGNVVFEDVYKTHQLCGKVSVGINGVQIDRILGASWRLETTLMVWGASGSCVEESMKFDEVVTMLALDEPVAARLEELSNELIADGDQPNKVGYRIRVIGR